jgi:hypothetical protein
MLTKEQKIEWFNRLLELEGKGMQSIKNSIQWYWEFRYIWNEAGEKIDDPILGRIKGKRLPQY